MYLVYLGLRLQVNSDNRAIAIFDNADEAVGHAKKCASMSRDPEARYDVVRIDHVASCHVCEVQNVNVYVKTKDGGDVCGQSIKLG